MSSVTLLNGHSKRRILGVGIIGCGEITQVAHIPTLGFLSDYFRVTYLCDISDEALEHSRHKVIGGIPKTTRDAKLLCASPAVDVIVIASADEYHADQAILALEHDKTVFVEKPLALNLHDIRRLQKVECASRGTVMVGYMRRYAAAFLDAVQMVGCMDKVLYARVRGIIGPNSAFVGQSGTFPKYFSDFQPEDQAERLARAKDMVAEALENECGVETSGDTTFMWRILGGLGSHDISSMRDVLGMPKKVLGVSLARPFLNVLFQFDGFSVTYESGVDNVPRFDCHIEVYGMNKSVRVQFDTPYVKGLPTTLCIRENVDGVYKETIERRTYMDSYTLEMKELYELAAYGKPVKTTVEDSAKDLEIIGMILRAFAKSHE